ncbi:hypothetical protein CBS101457_000728 [Exobasidium rhododendri]|nr:hypothetical protein CBS101457_000728 [Exobasidium rhododendri]
MSSSSKRPSKRSIVGSMGLPPYQKPAEPEWARKKELGSDVRSTSTLDREDEEEEEENFSASSIASPASRGNDSIAAASVPKSQKPVPTPVVVNGSQSDKAGKLGRFRSIGRKKAAAPAIPVDTRRRKYNKEFGKKTGLPEELEENKDDVEEEILPPQRDRQRTARAIRDGKGSSVGVIGAVASSDEPSSPIATSAEEVKSAAKARGRTSQSAASKNSFPVALPPARGATETHDEVSSDDDDLQDAQEVQAEPADVHDDESVAVIVNSSSLAPALTGGYLDEKVPTYDLTDPSKKSNESHFEDIEEKEANGHAIRGGLVAAGFATAGVGALTLAAEEEEEEEEGENDENHNMEEVQESIVEEKEVKLRPAKSPMRSKNDKAVAAVVAAEEDDRQKQRVKSTPLPPRKKAAKRTEAKIASLSAVQRHYLLKALVSLQMQQEFSELEKLGALTQYGYPFSLDRPQLKRLKKSKQLEGGFENNDFEEEADDPYADADQDEIRKREGLMEPLITRHMFHVHLHSFPGLDDAPIKYWQKRIQPFFDEMAARNFSTSMERSETTSRHFYTLAATRYLGGFFSRGFGVRGEGELKGPGKGVPGSDRWGIGKEWGKGTVKRGLDRPLRPDASTMDLIDNLFEGQEKQVWQRARKETTRVKRDWQGFKEFVIEKESGLEETMNYLDVGTLRNLPSQYRNAEEYARIHTAFIFHALFVTSPSADSFFSVLKGIHLLFPYWGAKQLLKVANAQTMIQGILSLLLARPAGSKSLIQRIFVAVIGGQGSAIAKECIAPLAKEINEKELCSKLEEYVKRGNRPEGRAIRSRATRTGQDVVATILLYSSGTQISESDKRSVLDMHDAFAQSPYRGHVNSAYPSSTPVGKEGKEPVIQNWGVSAEEQAMARKYAMLKLFLRECLKRRDRDEACKVASGSLIPSIIKDSLDTVFYGPIKHIAEVSDLSARLGDLQAFFDDIIKLKKSGDNSLPAWIALTARHENSLFLLFHECAPIMKPFTEWLQIGADYMALSTTDPAHPANRRAKNVEVNLEDLLADDRLSDEDVSSILAEVDQLAKYIKWQKIWYELEMRKDYLLAKGPGADDDRGKSTIPASGLCEDDIPGRDMKARIQDIDQLMKELIAAEGEELEEGIVENDARGTEMKDYPWAWFDTNDPLHQHLDETDPTQLEFFPSIASVKMPTLKATRKALEPFREVLVEKLPAWKEGDAKGVPATPKIMQTARRSKGAYGSDDRSVASPSSHMGSEKGAGANTKSFFGSMKSTEKDKKPLKVTNFIRVPFLSPRT